MPAASPCEVTCALEAHAQVNTKRKLFSGEIRQLWLWVGGWMDG